MSSWQVLHASAPAKSDGLVSKFPIVFFPCPADADLSGLGAFSWGCAKAREDSRTNAVTIPETRAAAECSIEFSPCLHKKHRVLRAALTAITALGSFVIVRALSLKCV